MRRVQRRKLLPPEVAEKALTVLEELARRLNAYISFVRSKRRNDGKSSEEVLQEESIHYSATDIAPPDIVRDDPRWELAFLDDADTSLEPYLRNGVPQ